VAGLVEHLVEPGLVLRGDRGLVVLHARTLGDEAALQVDHLEAQDRREPRAQRRAPVEGADRLERGDERLLNGLSASSASRSCASA